MAQQLLKHPLLLLLRDSRLWRGSGPIVVLLFVVLNVAIARQQAHLEEQRLRNLTSDDIASRDENAEIRLDKTFGENTRSISAAIPDSSKCRLVVLAGMSQMFSINDRQPGDQTISEEMDDDLRNKGTRVFGLAAPNLCNEEGLFLLLTTLRESRTKPAVFIFGACFDKFRNVDLRPGYQKWLKEDSTLRNLWEQTIETNSRDYPLAADKMRHTLTDIKLVSSADSEATFNQSVESTLRTGIATAVPAVSARKNLYSATLLQLFYLRNYLFNIKSSSKRPMISSRYQTNQQFFELIAKTCQENDIQFVTYVIPLNKQAENPYVTKEYEQFKLWFAEICERQQIPSANLEDLVPGDDWGFWMGGPDFKHFRGAGHRRVAHELINIFGPLLVTKEEQQ